MKNSPRAINYQFHNILSATCAIFQHELCLTSDRFIKTRDTMSQYSQWISLIHKIKINQLDLMGPFITFYDLTSSIKWAK